MTPMVMTNTKIFELLTINKVKPCQKTILNKYYNNINNIDILLINKVKYIPKYEGKTFKDYLEKK